MNLLSWRTTTSTKCWLDLFLPDLEFIITKYRFYFRVKRFHKWLHFFLHGCTHCLPIATSTCHYFLTNLILSFVIIQVSCVEFFHLSFIKFECAVNFSMHSFHSFLR